MTVGPYLTESALVTLYQKACMSHAAVGAAYRKRPRVVAAVFVFDQDATDFEAAPDVDYASCRAAFLTLPFSRRSLM